MAITARVEHGDSVLLIEIDDGQPTPLFMRGRVLEVYSLPTQMTSSQTAVVVVPPPVSRKTDRVFRLVSIQRIHERNGEFRRADTRSKVEKITKAFNRWIHAKLNGDGRKPVSLATFFGRFWTEEMKDAGVQNYSDLAYQIAYCGWRKKFWEIDDTGECKLSLLEQK
jgi:hypothetical protein